MTLGCEELSLCLRALLFCRWGKQNQCHPSSRWALGGVRAASWGAAQSHATVSLATDEERTRGPVNTKEPDETFTAPSAGD